MEYEVATENGVEGDGYWNGDGNEHLWATEDDYDQATSQGFRQPDGAWKGGTDYRDGYWNGDGNEHLWATEDDYDQATSQGFRQPDGAWKGGTDYRDGGQEERQSRSGSEPSQKKSKVSFPDALRNGMRSRNGPYNGEFIQGGSLGTPPASGNAVEGSSSAGGGSGGGRAKGTGRMFFKTKLCCKFKQGTCPYSSNCNFAHGMEELRKPPPNWQEIVAQQEEDRAERERRAENQIPCVSSSNGGGDMQRYHKTRLCKKFYTDEGCPYGDRCNFVHDDQRSRESVTISLGPTPSGGNGAGSANGNNGGNGSFQRPSNWKTRICNKWETTGHCPFGDKCHFAHGLAELQKYGGVLSDADATDTSGNLRSDSKQNGAASKVNVDPGSGSSSVTNAENSVVGSSTRSLGNLLNQRPGQRIMAKWKGPDRISRIYGDWIDDNEWEYLSKPSLQQFEKINVDEEIFNEV
eukprot:TRINITY_DN16048_c0_g1_i1.p1 TRINITY_DN16048_c0_g1~~TRINITY_DN16048_c0_g1_i1.p1  ORF type:complete len:463 (+),score=116.18 TRINITY_DN16048_c0_g1_i1:646-2034(+)